jgi:anti-sigma factor RsiW
MITCRDLVALLMEFVSGQLPPKRRDPVEQHLSRCSLCLAYLESYRTLVEVSRCLPPAPLPERLEQRLQTILRENGQRQETDRRGTDPLGSPAQ